MRGTDQRLHAAIGRWLPKLDKVAGWKEWKRDVLTRSLWHDDDWFPESASELSNFEFVGKVGHEHAIIMAYLALAVTVRDLRDCECYFRRYPFQGLPVTKYEHLRHICEMYFSRFYQFEERLGNLLNLVKEYDPSLTKQAVGSVIKQFKKSFEQELRERHNIHHREKFDDIAIDNIMLTELAAITALENDAWKKRSNLAYRKATREWAARAVQRSRDLEQYLDLSAGIVLNHCPFLSDLARPDTQ